MQSVLPGSSPPSSEFVSRPAPDSSERRLGGAPAGGGHRVRAHNRTGAQYTQRPPGPRAHPELLYTSRALAGGQGLRPRRPKQRAESARLAFLARPELNL